MNEAKEMMSDSLVDKFENDETFSFAEKVFLCSMDFIVSDKIETLIGIIESFNPCYNEKSHVAMKISTDDAFSIIEVWNSIKIKGYKLSLKGQFHQFEGVFKISRYNILNVDNDKSICSVSFELVKE